MSKIRLYDENGIPIRENLEAVEGHVIAIETVVRTALSEGYHARDLSDVLIGRILYTVAKMLAREDHERNG